MTGYPIQCLCRNVALDSIFIRNMETLDPFNKPQLNHKYILKLYNYVIIYGIHLHLSHV